METLEYRLDFYVNRALDAYIKSCKEQNKPALPIDLHAVARAIGNIDIEMREMIPEAAVELENQRFKIHLQTNFLNRPGALRRQRFSLAHEIAHTFFFELQDGAMKPVKGAPKSLRLEKACHEGAGMLLIPERFLDRDLKKLDGRVNGKDVLRWAEAFDVSVEVVLRRLQDYGALDSDDVSFALASDGRITFASYPPYLKSLLPSPSIQGDLVEWLSPKCASLRALEDGSYDVTIGEVALSAKRSSLSARRSLFEIRIVNRNVREQLEFAV